MAFSKRSAVNKSLDLDHGQSGPIPKLAPGWDPSGNVRVPFGTTQLPAETGL